MTYEKKALIILESLDEDIQIDWNFKEIYIGAIEKGLSEIRKQEKLYEACCDCIEGGNLNL